MRYTLDTRTSLKIIFVNNIHGIPTAVIEETICSQL